MQRHVLTFNWHDPYLHMFAQTGFRVSVGDWMRRADGTTGWDVEKRPLPENLTLLKRQAEAVALLKKGDCDVVLCHTLQDLAFVAPFDVPTIYLTHNALQNDGMNDAGTMARLQREVGAFLSARKGVFAAISPMKLKSWGMDGFVVRPGINLGDYAGYTGEKAAALSVGNLFVERDHMLGYRFLREMLDGVPHRLVGENPKLQQAKKAASWEDLKAHFRQYRVYVNATVAAFEDGYNLGMLEAMATGMPVVSYVNATSPIRDGENGYISSDTGYLKERVLALLEDLELAKALGQKARETVAAQFSVAAFVENWQEIVAESIRRKSKKATKHPRRLKVLVGQVSNPISTGRYYVDAFKKVHDVRTCGPVIDAEELAQWREAEAQHAFKRLDAAQADKMDLIAQLAVPCDVPMPRGQVDIGLVLDRLPKGWRPDVFVWIDSAFLPMGLEKLDCPAACLVGDTHTGQMKWRIDYARLFSHVFVMFARQHIPHFERAGCAQVHWLPGACDPAIHGWMTGDKTHDIGFVGQTHRQWHPHRVRLLQRLMDAGFDVRVESKILEEMALFFSRSRLVFNRSLNEDVNMRVFEALCSGSLLLTDRLPAEAGLEDLFRDKEHMVLYGEGDLEDLARYYLTHADEREAIAAAGRKAVLQGHTYAHRADQVMQTVFGEGVARCAGEIAGTRIRGREAPSEPGVAELAEYTGEDVALVRTKLAQAGDALKTEWRTQKRTSAAQVDAFYKETGQYLYDLTQFNYSPMYAGWRGAICNVCQQAGEGRVLRVLDYGGGIGTTLLDLADLPNMRLAYADLPGQTFDYARWRFARRGLDVEMVAVDGDDPLAGRVFDVIVCLDVIEHLVEPERAVTYLIDHLQPGGLLILTVTFYAPEPDTMHLNLDRYTNEGFYKIVRDMGMKELTAFSPRVFQKTGTEPASGSHGVVNADAARAFLKRWKGPVRLNLGCGEDRRQGYINVDAYVSSADLQMDVFDLPLDDGVADEIFSSHMLEHLGKHEVPHVLKTWHRVLKPGGILRLNVPDLSWVVENWLRLPEAQRWGWALDTIFGLQTHPGEYHKTGFTADRIRGLLSWAGFAEVQVSHIESHGQRCLWVEAKRPEALETKPRVSIVMPLFNKVDYTRACLEGLEAVRGAVPFEVILVDNGSTDGTRALLDGVENRPGYRVVRSAENLGFARGNNAGAQLARGDCLLFLNNDTVPHAGWLEAMVAELESDAGIGIVGARLLYPDTGRIQHAGLELINGVPDHVHRHAKADAPEVNRPRDLDMVTGACLLIRKTVFDRLGGFDTGYVNGVEDVDLCLRVRDLGYRVRYCPKAVLDHHEGTSAGRYDHVRPNLERFVQRWNGRFDAQGRFVPQAGTRLRGVWEGTQFVYHSLSLVNMALCAELIKAGCDLSLKPYEPATFGPEEDVARYGPLAGRLNAALDGAAQFHVRHMWPPDLTPPPEGHWVMIQPWEYGRIPARWVQPIRDGVDEMWVPSAYAKQCYVDSGVDADRVQVIPNGVHTDIFHPGAEPLVLDTEKTFKFLYVGGAIYRKGIDVLLEVYRRAFSRKDDVCLVIKTMGDATFYKKQSAAQTIREIQADPDAPEIVHIDSDLSDADMAGLYVACDCLVHPYRGEGFGLPVAEALACGLPVIVTKGGACDDFCSEDWAHFVPAVRKEVRYEEETAGAAWVLEPDREVLADRMKAAVADPEAGRRMGQRGSAYVREHLTWTRAAAQVMARLRALQERPVRRLQQAHLVDVFVLSDEGDVPEAIARFSEAPTCAVAGTAAALNAAWRQGTGACVALVRRDVVATEDYLDHMIAHFEADDTLAMVVPCLPVAEGEQAVKAKYQSTKRELQRFAKRLYLREKGTCVDVASVVGACAVVRRDVLEAFGGFDGGFLTPAFLDDLARRCRQAGLRVVCARDVFVHCEDRAPDEGEVRERRAVALLETGDGHRTRGEADAALAQYRAALEAKEDYLEAALICSAALLEQNRPKEAGDIFRRFLSKHPDSSRLHNYLGRCLFVAGEGDRGRAEFERAIELDPNFGEAYSNLGVLLWEQGQLDAALERMNRAAELAPESPDVIYNIGMIYAQLGQAKQATEVLQLYLELSPDDLHARTYLAVLLLENGAEQDGVTELERVLAADPNCEEALRVLAQLQAAADGTEDDG